MSTCLYCMSEAHSEEHPLPAAFGEFMNAPTLQGRICRQCNNQRLGRLDEHISRCGPEAFFRRWFGVKGRKHHKEVNPHYRGSAGGRRLEMKAYDASIGAEIELESQQGHVRQSCQLVVVEQSHKTHSIPIMQGMSSATLLAAYRSLGVSHPADVRVFCDSEERTWVAALIKETWPAASFGPHSLGETMYKGAEIKIQTTDRYFRGMAKIGFHYFLTQFPAFDGSEPAFADIRSFIIKDGTPVELANSFVGEREHPLLGHMMAGGRPDGWVGHVIAAEIRPEACLAYLQLFVSEHCRANVYTIRLGANDTNAPMATSGHLYAYFEEGPRGKFSGEAHPLDSSYSNAPVPPLKPVVNLAP